MDTGHDGVTGINTRGAIDTLQLSAIANIDASRANPYAGIAIDTVTGFCFRQNNFG